MANDDYDLLPHSELKKLEEEVQSLKKGTKGSSDNSIDKLNASLSTMIAIFNDAKSELRIEDEEKELLSKKIDPILTNLRTVIEHNEKIAEGILSVAEMIKSVETKIGLVDYKLSQLQQEVRERPEQKLEQANTATLRTEPQNQWQQQRSAQSIPGFEADSFAQSNSRPAVPGMNANQTPGFDPFGVPIANQQAGFGQQTNSPFGQQQPSFNQPTPGFGQQTPGFAPPSNAGFNPNTPPSNFGTGGPENQGFNQQPTFGPPPAFSGSDMAQPQQSSQNLPPPPPRPALKKGFFK